MNKLITQTLLALLLPVFAIGQIGHIIEWPGTGPLKTIDLATAATTFISDTESDISASDYGPNEVLYAINSGSNTLITIDVPTGEVTQVGTITPPADHTWMGLAYDYEEEVMYAMSAAGVASGTSALHTVDLESATPTLIGSQSDATGIACIAIDNDGIMYGLNLTSVGNIYTIDKH